MASLYRYLDTNGDGTGTKNANGDYSSAEEIFYIQPPANQRYELHRIIITLEDTSGFSAQEYGNLGAALTNGIEIKSRNNDVVTCDITAGIPIKTNAQWAALAFDVDLKSWGAGNELLTARLTFEKAGEPIVICGNIGGRLEVSLNDDFSGLITQYFMVQGYTM